MPTRFTTEQFIEKAKAVHGDLYDYSDVHYKNALIKVTISCRAHGAFMQKPSHHLSGQGCPYCAGKLVQQKDSLEAKFPEIAAQWDFVKNSKGPDTFAPYSSKHAWWKCDKGHSWKAKITNRTNRGSGCPFCAPTNRRAAEDNNLAVTNPELTAEWDYEANNGLTPEDVTSGSDKKVAWKCIRGHAWKAAIHSRASGKGCPKCRTAISGIELRVYSELKGALRSVKHHQFVDGIECDILVEGSPAVAVEVDGRYWHRNRRKADLKKNRSLTERGITVVRVRDHSLGKLGEHDVVVNEVALTTGDIKQILQTVCSIQGRAEPKWLQRYEARTEFRYDKKYQQLLDRLPLAMSGQSITDKHPSLAAMWDYEKNAPLTPDHFTSGSKFQAWWRCSKGHSFQRDIYNLTSKSPDCPHCSGRYNQGLKPIRQNSFGAVRPDLVWSWHPEKNSVSPYDIAPKSNKPRTWRCRNGHEWEADPYRRQREGCPFCAGYRLSPERTLAAVAPEVAAEWHQPKNGGITPETIGTSSSKIKPWWKCRDCGHIWQAALYDRAVKKTRCPKCSRRRKKR